MSGLLGESLGIETIFTYNGCSCDVCMALRESGPKKGVDLDDSDNSFTISDEIILGETEASRPGISELLPLQTRADGSRFITGNRDIDATLIGSRWTVSELTFSFPTDSSQYTTGYTLTSQAPLQLDLGEAQKAAARASYQMVSSFTNLTFREITEGVNGEQAILRLSQTGNTTATGSASGFFPASTPTAGDIWFGRTSQPFYDAPAVGNWGFATMMHEVGHTLGLKHGMDDYRLTNLFPLLDGPSPRYGTEAQLPEKDGQAWTLMTYRSNPGADLSFAGEGANQPQSYMQNDIAALQFMYGANFNFRNTGTTYTWSPTTGEMFVNGVGTGVSTANKIFETLWDGGGVDTYDLSNYTTNLTLDLRAGQFSTFSAEQLANNRAYLNEFAPAPGNIANALLYNGNLASLIENAVGGVGNDAITGNQVANVLTGGLGDDTLTGGEGSDLLDGGVGSDTAVFGGAIGINVTINSAGDVLVVNGADTDTLRGIESVTGSSADDTLIGDGAANTLVGGTGGVDTLTGNGGNDRLIGGGFTTAYVTTDSQPDIAKPATTNNGSIATAVNTAGTFDAAANPNITNATTIPHTTINAVATGGALEYYRIDVTTPGARGIFDIDGTGSLTDSIVEVVDSTGATILATNDTGPGDPGTTTGDDAYISYIFNTPGTYYVRVGRYTAATGSAAQPLLAGQTYQLHISLSSAQVDQVAVNTSRGVLTGGAGDDFIQGTLGDDTISGGDGNDTASFANAFTNSATGVTVNLANQSATVAVNTVGAGSDLISGIENLIGSSLNDTLTGDANSNVIEGGLGNDTLDGAGGVDTVSYANAASGVTVSLAATTAQNTVGAGSDTLSGFEILLGSAFNDTLSGDAAINTITGGLGDDVLSGNALGLAQVGTGADLLDGGAGQDLASFAGYTGSVVANLNGQFDSQVAVAGAVVAVLRGMEGVAGGSGNDRLQGDSGANALVGNAGNDDLSGQEGDDFIDGGAGDDIMSADGGNDTAVFAGATGVTVDLRITGQQNTGLGLDTLTGFENLVGGSGNDTLIGTDDVNVFTDTGGNDSYIGNGGVDTLSYAQAIAGVTMNLASIVAQTTGGGGSDTVLDIENLIGSDFNDALTGSTDANRLVGGAGIDGLVGGAGNDVLEGGVGNDLLVGDANGALSPADGADTLDGGAGNDALIGGLGDDVLRGGSGEDVLVQGVGTGVAGTGLTAIFNNDGGNDTLDGGDGTDLAYFFYAGRAGGVSLSIANSAALNTITVGGVAAGSVTSVERIIFRGGLGGDVITGNFNADTLIGNEGDDILNGAVGNDSLQGNAGNDTLIGGEGLDTITFAAATAGITLDLRVASAQNTGEGNDTVSGVEYLIGSGFSDVFRGDNEFNIFFDFGNNVTGSGGNDQFYGNGGNDILTVTRLTGAAANTITLDGGDGIDVLVLNSGTVSTTAGPGPSGATTTAITATGTRYADILTVNGGAGTDTIVVTAVDTATIDAGADNDSVSVSLLGAANVSRHTITLGSGSDTIQLNGTSVVASTTARTNVVTDFTGGATGDRFEMTTFLNNSLTGYTANANPFTTGHLILVQSGADLLLQVDRDGSAGATNAPVTLFTLRGAAATGGLTAFNFDGFAPNGLNLTGSANGETLTGSDGGETITGLGGADTLNGLGGNDTLLGGDGDDTLNGGAGNDTITGGAGFDTYVTSAAVGSVQISFLGNSLIVSGAEGTDTLTGIERFQFGDRVIDRDAGDGVDDLWYLMTYRDVLANGIDADAHYTGGGAREGRNPNQFFDRSYYLQNNPDVASSGLDPFQHYLRYGAAEDRNPSLAFDTSDYRDANRAAVGSENPLLHYLRVGMTDGLSRSALFDDTFYLQNNPDVAAARIDPYLHWNVAGRTENRDPNPLFDADGYVATYTDVRAAGIDAFTHYFTQGWKEGRDPSIDFDTTDYLNAYPDVAASGINPLLHWYLQGRFEGRMIFDDNVWG